MKISLNYLKQYLDFDLPEVNELAQVIGKRLGALEETPVSLGDTYKDVTIVKVASCQPIAGTDHLSLCLIDDSKKRTDVDRNGDGLIEVVCGAPNVREGILAAWLPPGSILPASYLGEQLVLEKRTIRDHQSNGMLASSNELALSDDHGGILILDKGSPGDSFAEVYELNDYILDIENKMFTHRPDCFGLIGVAREVSGILNHKFTSPSEYLNSELSKPEGDNLEVLVENEIPSSVPRFSLIVIDKLEVGPSPLPLQSNLSRMGIRPINNIVDLTNIVMLETGQPLHAYDYHKLQGLSGPKPSLTVRYPKPDETIKLLNGKEVKPSEGTICIASKDQLVGLGGIMGAENSEVDQSTTTIVLEAACFDMYATRRASMDLGVSSEAVTRFTKGQSPLQQAKVLAYAAQKLKSLAPNSRLASGIIDNINLPEATIERDSICPPINISADFINDRLGTSLTTEQVAGLLTNVECQVTTSGKDLTIQPPFWRTDLEIREDVVEEVGRLYGYENIEPKPLTRPVLAVARNQALESKSGIRRLLTSSGANEVLTYSFVSKRLIENAGQSVDKAFQIANSISPDLAYYRLSLTPSLLTKVQMNIKAGNDLFALFELGSYHLKGINSQKEADLPAEFPSIALVFASKQPKTGAAYFKAKQFLSYLIDNLNIADVTFQPLNKVRLDDHLTELAYPYDANRSAVAMSNNKQVGVVGEFTSQATSNFKLPSYCAGFEVDNRLFQGIQEPGYKPLPKYPPVKQDLTLKIPGSDVSFTTVDSILASELAKLAPKNSTYSFKPISIFKPKDSTEFRNFSFHLEITDNRKTMTDEEVNNILDKLSAVAKDKLSAERI